MTERILDFFKQQPKPHHLRDVQRYLRVGRAELKESLETLVAEGKLQEVRRHHYALPGTAPAERGYPGRLHGNPAGFGFVVFDDATRPDLYIPKEGLLGAWDGDRVLALPMPTRRGEKPFGRVLAISERKRQQLTGRLEFRKGFAWLNPDEAKLPMLKLLPKGLEGLEAGSRLAVKLHFPEPTRKTPRPEPFGELLRILSREAGPQDEAEAVIINHQLKAAFDPATIQEAEAIPNAIAPEWLINRTDFRQQKVFTIDGIDAKDFDDAIHLEVLENGRYRVGIHVADVSHYVAEGGAIDQEAYERATSVYLPGRVLPMLPEKLSNGVCSLVPGQDRLVMSVVVEISPAGKVHKHSFHQGVIHSVARLTYNEVEAFLEGGALSSDKALVASDLKLLFELSRKLKHARSQLGALDFNFPEVKVELQSEVIHLIPQAEPKARSLIEELMLLANRVVAKYLVDKEVPALFRVHEDPEENRFKQLVRSLAKLGYSVRGLEATPKALQEILKQAQGKPDAPVVATLLLRSLKLARYAPENLGHFGLAAQHYLHFTSPIRRYPDLVVHRILRSLMQGKGAKQKKRWAERLPDMAEHTSRRERAAEAAERELTKFYQTLWAQHRLGEVFEGKVSGVTGFGVFVTLDPALGVEGLIRFTELKDDHYHFQEDTLSLLGSRSGKQIRLGDPMKVKIAAADAANRQIDLVLEESSSKPRKASTKVAAKPNAKGRKVVGPPDARQGGFSRPVKVNVGNLYFGAWGETREGQPPEANIARKRSRRRGRRR